MASQERQSDLEPGMKLATTRALSAGAIALERFWPLVLPLLLSVGIFLILTWFGFWRLLPIQLSWILQGLCLLYCLDMVWKLRQFSWPTASQVNQRIEHENGLSHAPLSTQSQTITNAGDPFAAALWHKHQETMAVKIGPVFPVHPKTSIPSRDPYALRALIPLLLVIAYGFSSTPAGGKLSDIWQTPSQSQTPLRIDAWITPPGYTGKAPIFLNSKANQNRDHFQIPQGSQFVVRLSQSDKTQQLGDEITLRNSANVGTIILPEPQKNDAQNTLQFSGILRDDGELILAQDHRDLKNWQFEILKDTPPTIEFNQSPKRQQNGSMEITYFGSDDYGIVSGQALISLQDSKTYDAVPLYEAPKFPLSIAKRAGKQIKGKTAKSLIEHPWAGLDVNIQLKALDASDQEGLSENIQFQLPARPFSNTLAKALVEQRQLLALDITQINRVLLLMESTLMRPQDDFIPLSQYLAISSAKSRLRQATSTQQLRDVVDYLWEIAVQIEDGGLTAAQKRLQDAIQALREAIKNGADEKEITQLMNEMRQAMNNYLQEFAQRNANNQQQNRPENVQELSQSQLDEMLKQLEDMAKSGGKDQAQDMLSRIENMLKNLQTAQGNGQNGKSGEKSEMQRQLDQLGNMMRQQQQLMDKTFEQNKLQQQQRGDEGQSGGQMPPEDLSQALKDLQKGQGKLREQLQEFSKGMGKLGIKPGEGFGIAQDEMRNAEKSLGNNKAQQAIDQQAQAMQAMRQGSRDLMKQLREAMKDQEGGSQSNGRQQSAKDPLGRERQGQGFDSQTKTPNEIDAQRAREILNEIRKRLGNALSPEQEKNYLERLLQMQ